MKLLTDDEVSKLREALKKARSNMVYYEGADDDTDKVIAAIKLLDAAPTVEQVAWLYSDNVSNRPWASMSPPSSYAPNELSEYEVTCKPLYARTGDGK